MIARQTFPPPQSSRRIAPIAKAKGEDRPNARDLLATVNSASSGASTSWIAFLGTMAYLAVALGGVTHVQLLLNEPTTLPFVNVKVPLDTFFVAAPLAFVLVHFGLLLQHVMLSRKLAAFEERLHQEQPSRDRRTQHIRDELHSYSFVQLLSGKPKGVAVDLALRLVMSLTLVVMPLLLLTFFQIGFLPYHSEPVTWWHRGMLLVDVGVVIALARYLARRDRDTKVRLTDWWHGTSAFKARLIVRWRRTMHAALMALSRSSPRARGLDAGPIVPRTLRPVLRAVRGSGTVALRGIAPNRLIMGALVFFSICVATLPDTDWDPMDRWMASIPGLSEPVPYCRDILEATDGGKEVKVGAAKEQTAKKESVGTGTGDVTKKESAADKRGVGGDQDTKGAARTEPAKRYVKECPKVTSATRRAFYPTAYLFEHEVNATTGKSDSTLGWSRNLIVTDKDLVDDDKKEGRLNLRGRDFRYATLDRSDLKRGDFYGASLAGARLSETDLSAANFATANLQGAHLLWAKLQGANLDRAELQGAFLAAAELQGAFLERAGLQGATLTEATLQGAFLKMAELQGAELVDAKLQGANLFRAKLQGANLDRAELQRAILEHAELQGASLRGAKLQGAFLDRAELQGADLSRASLWRTSLPGNDGKLARDLVTFARLGISVQDDNERKALAKTIAELEKLPGRMAKESAAGRLRAKAAAGRVGTWLRPLFESEGDDKWSAGRDFRAWCELARRPRPDPAKLSAYLGKLACDDDTDKAYIAQRLVADRVLPDAFRTRVALNPGAFVKEFKACSGFSRIPADLKARLETAEREESEHAANASQERTQQAETPPSPELPKACAELADNPAKTTGDRASPPPPNPPSSAPH